jgi:hypothetical protein
LSDQSTVTIEGSGRWEMNGVSDTVAALSSGVGQTSGVLQQGAAALTLAATSGSNTYYGTITGTGTFTKNGGASQTLAGSNSLGAVNVNGGTLAFGSNSSMGAVAVNGGSARFQGVITTGAISVSNGTLGGSGSVSGGVTINNGGHLAPGDDIKTLAVASLTLNAGAVLEFELGNPNFDFTDRVNVGGAFSINGGSLEFTNSDSFKPGFFTILNYGTMTGSLANLTTTGPADFSYELYDMGNYVGLLAGIPGDFNADNIVDNTDYVLWRKAVGTTKDLYNDRNVGGVVGSEHYQMWVENFGRNGFSAGSGGGSGNVPEPAAAILMLGGMAMLGCSPRRR